MFLKDNCLKMLLIYYFFGNWYGGSLSVLYVIFDFENNINNKKYYILF